MLTVSCLIGFFTQFFAYSQPATNRGGLVWDSLSKEASPLSGEITVIYHFAVTNASTNTITIERIEPSCGCTKVETPAQPWKLSPNEDGQIKVTLDAQGKQGTLNKSILVYTSSGPLLLHVVAHLPTFQSSEQRENNMKAAASNRQAVFRGSCAACHVTPTFGKLGQPLYDTACGICHSAENRASMVPDLKSLKVATNKSYWEQWIRSGKTNSLMPAFEQKQAGILSEQQIQSLVEFLATNKNFPSNLSLTNSSGAKH